MTDIKSIIEPFVAQEGGLLPCLHEIQKRFGYIDPSNVELIARAFNLSRAEVHGTMSFYHFFKTSPGKKVEVQICRAESCQSMGSRQLVSQFEEAIQSDATLASEVDVAAVYCLGNCACSPCARIGDDVMGDLTAEQLVEATKARVGVLRG
jgi:formate dehydrogenase subunit gamma